MNTGQLISTVQIILMMMMMMMMMMMTIMATTMIIAKATMTMIMAMKITNNGKCHTKFLRTIFQYKHSIFRPLFARVSGKAHA